MSTKGRDKQLILDFERILAELLAKGVEKPIAERDAMRSTLLKNGWSLPEARNMTDRIFAHKDAMRKHTDGS